MITIPAHLQTMIDSEVMTLCTCWKVTLQNGTILGYTDHDVDIIVSGLTYSAVRGFSPSAFIVSNQLNVDNMQLTGLLNSGTVNAADLSAGIWDYAIISIFFTDYNDPAGGIIQVMNGSLGNVTVNRNSFTADLRGLMQPLQNQFGQVYSPVCRAKLGDARCTLDLTPYTFAGTVTSVTSDTIFIDTSLTQADNYFQNGIVTWTSGANTGFTMEVKSFVNATATVTLQLGMAYTILTGDTYNIVAGCDKLYSTCLNKFSNFLNFRGEPFVPGTDVLTQGPTS